MFNLTASLNSLPKDNALSLYVHSNPQFSQPLVTNTVNSYVKCGFKPCDWPITSLTIVQINEFVKNPKDVTR